MILKKPEPYHQDTGRTLSEAERLEVAGTITPIESIMSRTCKQESTNDKWRLGRK